MKPVGRASLGVPDGLNEEAVLKRLETLLTGLKVDPDRWRGGEGAPGLGRLPVETSVKALLGRQAAVREH